MDLKTLGDKPLMNTCPVILNVNNASASEVINSINMFEICRNYFYTNAITQRDHRKNS